MDYALPGGGSKDDYDDGNDNVGIQGMGWIQSHFDSIIEGRPRGM